MKVIIPLAGKGTRLRPHTHSKAKPLVNLAGKTVLGHIIERIKSQLDVNEFIFIIGPNQKEVELYLKDNFDIKFKCLVQEEPFGPGHAVWIGKDEIKHDDDILVVYSDTIFIADLNLIKTKYNNYDGLIFTKKTNEPEKYGIATTQDGVIVNLVEKPKEFVGDLAVVGMYYFKNGLAFMQQLDYVIQNNMKEKGEFYINTPILLSIKEGMKFGAPTIEEWLDCGNIQALLDTNRRLLKKKGNNKIIEGNLIVEPCFIGDNVKIRNSVIGPYVSIHENTEIYNSIIKDSIIGKETKLEDVNLADSVVGDSVVIKGIKNNLNVGDHTEIK